MLRVNGGVLSLNVAKLIHEWHDQDPWMSSLSRQLLLLLHNLVIVFGDARLSNLMYMYIKICAIPDRNSVSYACLKYVN
jgi:hypothetical protein